MERRAHLWTRLCQNAQMSAQQALVVRFERHTTCDDERCDDKKQMLKNGASSLLRLSPLRYNARVAGGM